jgi:salicylate hydroxylase
LELFSDFHPSASAILDKITEVKQWPLLFRYPIPTWVKGRMTVVGDAAHPMLPHQGQGGAQSIEDGVALGIAFCGAGVADVEARLAVYDRIRRIRASAIQIFSNAGQDQAHRIRDEASKFIPAEKVPSKSSSFGKYVGCAR